MSRSSKKVHAPRVENAKGTPRRLTAVREIARGGFGAVTEVRDASGGRWARKTLREDALDQLAPDEKTVAAKRFRREVKVQSSLAHPNIVPIVEHHLDEEPPWFLMPLASESFAKLLASGSRNIDDYLPALLDVLSGLEELHRLEYVHRDLKPENILHLGDKWALADLGLVVPLTRDTSSATSTAGGALGSALYMAPEQMLDFKHCGPEADVYAFGCLLHDAVAGSQRLPFRPQTATGPLGAVIERCTLDAPRDRFHEIGALREALVFAASRVGKAPEAAEPDELLRRLAETPATLTGQDWQIVARLTREDRREESPVKRALDRAQLEVLQETRPDLLADICFELIRWIEEGKFYYGYCDVLAGRLKTIANLGGLSLKSAAAVAALRMGCSHNRFHVMRVFLSMTSQAIDSDLADRMAIDLLATGPSALQQFKQIEANFEGARERTHPTIVEALERIGS